MRREEEKERVENNKNWSGVFSLFNWIRFVEVKMGREREEGRNGKKELQQEESF